MLLRAYRPEDAPDLQRAADNPAVAKTLRPVFPHPYTLEDAKWWIDFSRRGCTWAITLGGHVIGNIGLLRDTRDWVLDRFTEAVGSETSPLVVYAELGYWLAEEHWGQGHMSEAVGLVLDFLRGHVRGRREGRAGQPALLARAMVSNPGSRRILEKAGFQCYREVPEAEEQHPVAKDPNLADCVDFVLPLA